MKDRESKSGRERIEPEPPKEMASNPEIIFTADTARPEMPGRMVRVQASYFEGPYPPPDMLREIDDIVPGAARQIIEDYVRQAEHRRMNESKTIDANISDRSRGMWLGAGLSAMVIVSGTIVATSRDARWGAAIIAAAAGLLATSYLKALSDQRKELANKRRTAKTIAKDVDAIPGRSSPARSQGD